MCSASLCFRDKLASSVIFGENYSRVREEPRRLLGCRPLDVLDVWLSVEAVGSLGCGVLGQTRTKGTGRELDEPTGWFGLVDGSHGKAGRSPSVAVSR